MTTSAHMKRLVGAVVASALVALALPASAAAVQPGLRWDSGGFAEVQAPPFAFDLELADFESPREITQRQTVALDVGAAIGDVACSAQLVATPTLNGVPIAPGSAIDVVDDFDYDFDVDSTRIRIPVRAKGDYALRIEGSFTSPAPDCSTSPSAPVPYATTIELFSFDKDLPGPASKARVAISSSGPRTLVARTSSRSPSIRITFTITDRLKRKDLLHSICMRDRDDCWFEDAKLVKRSYIRKTSTGWVRTWDFWWERTSPSDCVSYYWQQPNVSILLIVSNRDGKTIGRKKHTVHLTCRG